MPDATADSRPEIEIQSLKARAAEITKILRNIYPDRAPLLHFQNPFELLIGVILSAQTTDAQVNRITRKLFTRFPNAKALGDADPAEVEAIVHSTGFFRSKARNIIAAAGRLHEKYGGKVPHEMSDLTELAGVGRKSANVIRGVVYGEPAIVVDTHLARVSRRLGLTSAKDPAKIEVDLQAILAEADHTDFSMAANRHGRRICTARAPRCFECPVAALCPKIGLQ